MAQQGKAWLVAMGAAYCFSCFLLILAYETHFRSLLVDNLQLEDEISNQRRRTTAVAHPSKPKAPRFHHCQYQNQTLRLPAAPNLILAGAMKSGTTYFWHLLNEHPEFIPSKKFEAHFFDWKFAVPPRNIKDPSFWKRFNATTEEDYLCSARRAYIKDNFQAATLMKAGETRISYEKTPNYMFLPQVPDLIHKICPWKPKIILLLRNPVDRAYSHFVMDQTKERTRLSFEEYVRLELETLQELNLSNVPSMDSSQWGSLDESDNSLFEIPQNQRTQEEADHANWMVYRRLHLRNYLHRGMYSVQLERWMKFFALGESLMVIHNERLLQEPRKVMAEVLKFVGAARTDFFADPKVSVTFDLEKQKKRELLSPHMNMKGMSDLLKVGGYNPMSNATRHFLQRFFKPYNAKLEELLGDEWKDVWNYAR